MDDASSDQPQAAPSQTAVATTVNPQMLDSVNQTQTLVLGKAGATGDGIAFQKVAQSSAFAIQDATDYLRNIMTMAATAQGVAIKLFLETKNPVYATALASAQEMVTKANTEFAAVGEAANKIVSSFPKS